MKVIFDKAILLKALTPAMGSVSTRNTIAAVEGIRMTTKENTCVLSAYDLEKGLESEIPAVVSEGGSYIINAGKLLQIVRLLPDGAITVEVDANCVAKIHSGKSEFELHALEGKEFPNMPELSGDMGFTIQTAALKRMISLTSFAIAQNDHRPALNGAYFRVKGGHITLVACDGNRLALRESTYRITNKFGADDALDLSFIIPGKTLLELMKLMSEAEETMTLLLTHKHIVFTLKDSLFFSRLIDSEYIDYERFIPKQNKTFAEVDPEAFTASLERASLVTEDRTMGQARSAVKCNFAGNTLTVTSVSVTGRVYDEIPITKEGDDIEMGFNCRYLLDALRACDNDKVKISMSTPLMSMIIEPAEDSEAAPAEGEEEIDGRAGEKFLMLVLPVRMRE